MGHAHIVWVLLSAARIAVRALDCFTSHIAEPVGLWNGLCHTGFETKQFIKLMCVHFEHIIIRDRICIEFCMDNFYQHKFFSCDIKIYLGVLMPRLNGSVGDRSHLFDMKKFIHSFILGGGLPYT